MNKICALATDFDGTIATDSVVSTATELALARWRRAGRSLILATGRELPDLNRVYPNDRSFDAIVAENGAVVRWPAEDREEILAPPPDPRLVDLLRTRGVQNLSVGRSIIATWEPYQHVCLEAIRELGLELQVTFNKGAVMLLPAGVNKASGVATVLERLGVRPEQTAAVGDAENDHALLALCGLRLAVANAVDALKRRAHVVSQAERGAGVEELINRLLDEDLLSPCES